MKRTALLLLVTAAACSGLELDPPGELIHARFDPDESAIPMPTDILRDAELGRLDLPVDDEDLTAPERAFYEYLNELDGWSSAMAASVEFTAPINPETIDDGTVQVWEWRETPRRVEDVRISLNETETELTIDAPRHGWARGGKYVVMVRGGAAGIEGKRGELVEADAAFYFLRLQQALNDGTHPKAIPGDSAEERQENADDLEEIRLELSPFFDFFETRGVERKEVAALWSFTVTKNVELAMDKASQRMPLPIDLIVDPDTGLIDLPAADWDTETIAGIKEKLGEFDGFGTSMDILLTFTGPLDIESISDKTIQLYQLGEAPEEIPYNIEVLEDQQHVIIEPLKYPLDPRTTYGVVVRKGIRAVDGSPVAKMPVGHFLTAQEAVFADGHSLLDAVPDKDAHKAEAVRQVIAPFVETVGKSDVLTAWSFTTMDTRTNLRTLVGGVDVTGLDPDPKDVEHMGNLDALLDFPIGGIASLFYVGDVYHGTIESPIYLDKLTRGMRADKSYELEGIPFTMTVPKNVNPDEPLPVVIFGHGLVSERRFVLSVGDALAARGFVAIAIDFPYHGKRTYCWSEGPLSIPNPTTGELTPLGDPCEKGYTCQEDGRCVDAAGQGNHLANWPIVGMPRASGAAMLELEHISNTRDHMWQGVVDLKALSYSIRHGEWESIIGAPFKTDEIYYAGQSLGGIIGSMFVSLAPEVKRAVLNVPGADVVDLFQDSSMFGFQVDAFLKRENVAQDSYEDRRFMSVAKWFMDEADPHSFVHALNERDREVMVQMATADFIIPNPYTEKLVQIAGVPKVDYLAEHAFIILPIEPAYIRGVTEMADFLAGEFQP